MQGGMDGDVDFLREALRVRAEGIMDVEVSARIGAEYGERSPDRVTQRSGVSVPGAGYPGRDDGVAYPEASGREPRRRSERALPAVIQQAHVAGVSTRRVDDLVKALRC